MYVTRAGPCWPGVSSRGPPLKRAPSHIVQGAQLVYSPAKVFHRGQSINCGFYTSHAERLIVRACRKPLSSPLSSPSAGWPLRGWARDAKVRGILGLTAGELIKGTMRFILLGAVAWRFAWRYYPTRGKGDSAVMPATAPPTTSDLGASSDLGAQGRPQGRARLTTRQARRSQARRLKGSQSIARALGWISILDRVPLPPTSLRLVYGDR